MYIFEQFKIPKAQEGSTLASLLTGIKSTALRRVEHHISQGATRTTLTIDYQRARDAYRLVFTHFLLEKEGVNLLTLPTQIRDYFGTLDQIAYTETSAEITELCINAGL